MIPAPAHIQRVRTLQACPATPRGAVIASVLVCLCLVLTGCVDGPVSVDMDREEARLIVEANVSSVQADEVVIEVQAPDIATPLLFNLPVDDDVAQGTITVPAGDDRLLTASVFDEQGVETHRGSRTLEIRPGPNDTVSITLHPIHGDQPIDITVGSFTVSISPDKGSLAPGEQLQLEAAVTDADGDPVDDADLAWGSMDTAIATVDASGLVTAHAAGEVQIVAVYHGAAADALLTVEDP